MSETSFPIRIRTAAPADAPELCGLLNEIIEIGGTTAYELPLTVEAFEAQFLSGPDVLSCLVAEDPRDGRLLGFQALERNDALSDGWGDIATFARARPKRQGVGSALFAATRKRAEALGLVALNATIRADNAGGLAYYARMGFEDYAVTEGRPLRDGTPVDRISKRLRLAPA